MPSRAIQSFLLVVFSLMIVFVHVGGTEFAIGLRVGLPLGDLPLLIGLELGVAFPVGWGVASLLIGGGGKTLFLMSYEYPLIHEDEGGSSRLRFTIGVSYFDLNAPFPTPLAGGGVAYRHPVSEMIQVALSGDLLYPIALRVPLLTAGGGWFSP
jgi:hypothetical protein